MSGSAEPGGGLVGAGGGLCSDGCWNGALDGTLLVQEETEETGEGKGRESVRTDGGGRNRRGEPVCDLSESTQRVCVTGLWTCLLLLQML